MGKARYYEPELGQACFGNPWGEYEATEPVQSFLMYILDEIARVFWNNQQQEWDRHEDPNIPGIEFRGYYWGGDEEEAAKPNFKLLSMPEVELRWYKYPGRGLTVNRYRSLEEWALWFEECLAVIRAVEVGAS